MGLWTLGLYGVTSAKTKMPIIRKVRATWLGMVIGMLIKIALTFLMIGIFVFALVTP